MDPVQKVIEVAKSQIGYLEKSKSACEKDPSVLDSFSDGAGSDNYTKYARDLWAVKYFNGSKQGTAWCGTFASWVYYTAFGSKPIALALQCQPATGNCGAGCEWIRRYYKEKGRWTDTPSPGDQVVFQNEQHVAQHTGIVVAVGDHTITTVEGNTNGAVRERGYDKSNPKIAGYGHPDWSIISGQAPEEGNEVKKGKIVLPKGSTGTTVNVRISPGGKFVDRVKEGTEVDILEDRGEWCLISSSRITGWVMANYVEYDGQKDDGPSMSDEEAYILITNALNTITAAVESILDVIGRG